MALGVDDLATNLVASSIFEGLKRPFMNVRSFSARRRDIKGGLEGEQNTRASVAQLRLDGAMEDLIRVLGNEYGAYTKAVDRFLLELTASAVPTALYRLHLIGKDPSPVYPAFELLHTTFSPLPFEAPPLFDAFSRAVKARIDQAALDPTMVEILRATTDDIRREITTVASALEQANGLTPLPADLFLDTRVRIAKSIEAANRDLPVETERGTRRVIINRLVIPARLSRIGAKAISGGDRDDDEGMPLADFKRGLHRAVVVGDPGGGKSTLTQLVCYEAAKRLTLDVVNNQKHIEHHELRLPLRIIVRAYDRRQRIQPGYTILDYLRDELRPALDNNGKLTERFLREVLITGKALLLFDGLDEVLEVGRRREMTGKIEQFLTAYAACPALVTSRVVGYNDAPMGEEFEIYLLSRLDEPEILKYAEKLIKAIDKSQQDPKAQALVFLKQTESHASDLRVNPLLLGLMVYIFMERGDVPDNRPEIYQACSQLLFLKWDQRRDILFEYPADFELLDLFGHLAVQIFGDPETEEGVSGEWLLDRIKTFFHDWYNDRAKASQAAQALVTFITGRAWVMCDVGPQVYKFTHRTFLEYFVARRLESESDSVSDLLSKLYPRVIDAEWDVVSHLALQIATSSGPKAARAVDALLALVDKPGRSPAQEINFLVFVARALEYLSVPEGQYMKIAVAIMERASVVEGVDVSSSVLVLTTLLARAKKKVELCRDLIVGFLRNELNSEDQKRVRFARIVIASRPISYFGFDFNIVSVPVSDMTNLRNVTKDLRVEFEPSFLAAAQADMDAARLYILTYNRWYAGAWERFGSELILFASDPASPQSYNELRFILANNIISGIDKGWDSDKEAFVRDLCTKAMTDGISVKAPLGMKESQIRHGAELADIMFRQVYITYRSFRAEKTSKAKHERWRLAFIMVLTFAEIDYRLFPKVRGRKRSPNPIKRNKGWLPIHLPESLMDSMVAHADRIGGNTTLSDWMNGLHALVRTVQR